MIMSLTRGLTHSERGQSSAQSCYQQLESLACWSGARRGEAGVVAGRFEHARAYVAEAYGARVEVEQRNAAK